MKYVPVGTEFNNYIMSKITRPLREDVKFGVN